MTKIEWFFEFAKVAALKSKDRSTKVGCVIVGPDDEIRSVGYNGFVRRANDTIPEWHERPLKYDVTAHAEENAVSNAARIGVSLKDCVAYSTLPPCTCCTRMFVQSGVKTIRFLVPLENKSWDERWGDNFRIALTIMRSGKVVYNGYSGLWLPGPGLLIDSKFSEVQAWISRYEGSTERQLKLI